MGALIKLAGGKWFDTSAAKGPEHVGGKLLYKTRKGTWIWDDQIIQEAKLVSLIIKDLTDNDWDLDGEDTKAVLEMLPPNMRKKVEQAKPKLFPPDREV